MGKYFTTLDLKNSHACEGGRRKFKNAFPLGKVALTRKNLEHFVFRPKNSRDQVGNAVQASVYLGVMLHSKGLITEDQLRRFKDKRKRVMIKSGQHEISTREEAQGIVDALVVIYKLRWE